MKISINESESYEFKMPEGDVSIQQLSGIVSRLQSVLKMVSKNPMIEGIREKRKYNVSGTRIKQIWTKDRDEAVKLLKLHYTGTKEEKLAYAKLHNVEWKLLVNRTFRFRKKWDIKPKELGIKQFMPRGQFRSGQ
jgi:hypothetical protein